MQVINTLRARALELIEDGCDPLQRAHAIIYEGCPEGDYLSPPLPLGADETGLTAFYRTLADWASFPEVVEV